MHRVAASAEHPAEKNGGFGRRISLYRRLSSASLNASSTVSRKYPPGVLRSFESYLYVSVTVVFVCSLSTEQTIRGSACGGIFGLRTTGFAFGCPGAGAQCRNATRICSATASRSSKSPAAITAMRSGRYHFL